MVIVTCDIMSVWSAPACDRGNVSIDAVTTDNDALPQTSVFIEDILYIFHRHYWGPHTGPWYQ